MKEVEPTNLNTSNPSANEAHGGKRTLSRRRLLAFTTLSALGLLGIEACGDEKEVVDLHLSPENKYPLLFERPVGEELVFSEQGLLTTDRGSAISIDYKSGEELWRQSLSIYAKVLGSENGLLYLEDRGNTVSVNNKTGKVVDYSSRRINPDQLAVTRPYDIAHMTILDAASRDPREEKVIWDNNNQALRYYPPEEALLYSSDKRNMVGKISLGERLSHHWTHPATYQNSIFLGIDGHLFELDNKNSSISLDATFDSEGTIYSPVHGISLVKIIGESLFALVTSTRSVRIPEREPNLPSYASHDVNTLYAFDLSGKS